MSSRVPVRYRSRKFFVFLLVAPASIFFCAHAFALNPFSLLSETYSDWKARLFGKGHPTPSVIDAPAKGPIALQTGHPPRLQVDVDAPERGVATGQSRYLLHELPGEL